MSDSSTSGSYTHATSVSNIFGLRPLQFPDHLPRHDPSQSSDQPPAISIPILNPPNRPSNLDHHTTSEFLDGLPGSPVSSDSDRELRSFFAAHFTRQEETEAKFATEVTSNLVKMNAKLDALNGSFGRQEELLTAILDALRTRILPLPEPGI